jgi:hypothetical protein
MNMSEIKEGMPLLARHEGEWKGVYTYIDPDGNIIDKHKSHLSCTFPEKGEYDYVQINRYEWEDGKKEERIFPAVYRDKHIWWDNELINGRAWEVDKKTVVLTWTRNGEPGVYLYEMIQLSEDGNDRGRTWHWFKDDKLYMRTIIKEKRTL